MTSVPSGNLAPLPGEIPDKIAGGLPVGYLSAFLALRQAGFREGQSVLAPGAGVNGRKLGEGGCRSASP